MEGEPGIIPGTTGQVDPYSAFPIAGDAGLAEGTGTGQFGIAPIVEAGTSTIGGAVTGIWHWLNRPFTSPMSAIDVFLLVGIVLTAVLVWNLVLYHIRIAAEAV
jgi:hypothetical protein